MTDKITLEYIRMGYTMDEALALARKELELKKEIQQEQNVFKPKPKAKKTRNNALSITVTDHLGNVYPSNSEMCRHYGISLDTYYFRIKRSKWSKARALTEPVKKKPKP